MTIAWTIALFTVFLMVSFFFSGSESACFTLSQIQIRNLRENASTSVRNRRLLRLLEKPRRLLMTILIGNTVVNVAAATVAALFTGHLVAKASIPSGSAFLIEIVVVTMIILVLSEVTPKVFAVRQALKFALAVSFPLTIIVALFYPVTALFEVLTNAVASMLGVRREAPFVNEEELKILFELGEEKGTLDRDEKEMIHSIFEFRETMVREVMVPRTDMVCVPASATLNEVIREVKETGYSRIPVYEDTIDNIIGLLFVKDLLPVLKGKKNTPSLSDLVRKAYFVPETKRIDELLREFQKERIHMAVVVDEYGGTAGLVTLENVIEEIVGDIRDEFDHEKPLIRAVHRGEWLVDGKIDIEEFNKAVHGRIPVGDDFETLGGFLLSLFGRIPQDGEEVRYQNLVFVIDKVHGRRIRHVRVKREKVAPDDQKV
jgi:putative hemolysin